jgi:hypothetical protein
MIREEEANAYFKVWFYGPGLKLTNHYTTDAIKK